MGIGGETESHPLCDVGEGGHLSEYQALVDTGKKEHVTSSVGTGAWSESELPEDRWMIWYCMGDNSYKGEGLTELEHP